MTVSKKELLRFVQGHARGNQAHALERKKRLESLTVEQAREEYDSLCNVWQNPANPPLPERMWERRLGQKIFLRSRLNKLGVTPFDP